MIKYPYQITLLGYNGEASSKASNYLKDQFKQLGLSSEHFIFYDRDSISNRIRKAPCAVLFFGYEDACNQAHNELDNLIRDSLLIVPVVDNLDFFNNRIPQSISHYNGVEGANGYKSACTAVLEHFRLLRAERRLFISYKRSETSSVAHQLYEAFDKNGYDVFLDTRSVPHGDIFQDVLWHRMADSDVVILLDSPKFHESTWTQEEYARAIASQITIQHILWPDQACKNEVAFDEFFNLSNRDFSGTTTGNSAFLIPDTIEKIISNTESSRARAISARNTMLIDGFCDLAREHGFQADLQSVLSIQLLANSKQISVIPMVGVPTAMRMHDLISKTTEVITSEETWAIFDDNGILDKVASHIGWLNERLPVKALSKASTRNALRDLKSQ